MDLAQILITGSGDKVIKLFLRKSRFPLKGGIMQMIILYSQYIITFIKIGLMVALIKDLKSQHRNIFLNVSQFIFNFTLVKTIGIFLQNKHST